MLVVVGDDDPEPGEEDGRGASWSASDMGVCCGGPQSLNLTGIRREGHFHK